MLKRRLVGVILVRHGVCVQSVGFGRYLPVGSPVIAAETLNRWSVDEIVIIDISAPATGDRLSADLIRQLSTKIQVPLAVGGGLRSLEDAHIAITSGADRVIFNSALVHAPQVITAVVERFGKQATIVAIDARAQREGRWRGYVDGGLTDTGLDAFELARRAEHLGAGEILIQSVDRDGSKAGYDVPLVETVAAAVSLPVIALGGVGRPEHLLTLRHVAGVEALAVGNYLHFTEHSALVARAFLLQHGLPLRDDSYASYNEFSFDADGRIAKKRDADLEEMMFVRYHDEVI